MKPTLQQVKVDKALTNLSISLKNEAYIADAIMPIVNVDHETGLYYVHSNDKFRNVERDLRAPGAESNNVDFGLATSTYGPITEKSLAQKLPIEVVNRADNQVRTFNLATENVHERLMIGRELRLSTFMANTANITQNVTLAGGDQFDDYANSDPVNVIKSARQAIHASTLKDPNTLVLGKLVYDSLLDHPDVLERRKYSSEGIVDLALLARLFDVDRILVGKAAYNNAKEGQSDSLEYIWGKNAWLTYTEPSPRLESISFGYTLQIGNQMVDRWYDQSKKSWFVRESVSYQQKAVALGAAYLIKNAVS